MTVTEIADLSTAFGSLGRFSGRVPGAVRRIALGHAEALACMKRCLTALLSAGALLAAEPMTARAAEPPFVLDPEPWRFNIAPYAWAIGITGNVTARNQTIDTNASAIDLLQKGASLIGLMTYFEADKGPVGFYTDFVFAKLGFGVGQTN